MIRVIVFAFLFPFCVGDLIAQKSASISINVTPQRTMFLNKDEYKYKGIVRNSPTYAYSYSVLVSQNFTSRLGLHYGFCGSRVEQEFKIYPFDGDHINPAITNRKSVLYLNIPLLLRVELISRSKNVVFVSAGPQASFLVSEDGIIPIYYDNYMGIPTDSVRSFDIAEAAGAYQKFVLAAAGALGWNTKLYKNFFLQFMVRTDYTLTDIENKSYDALFADQSYQDVYLIYNKNRPATHILTLGFGVGVGLKFR